ncbi:E3 ubiquitin-protein ligase Topors-like [Grus japonensis]|uniref:E3 ubiquitin-protein ligase Topors-like n=1 Tax=Grus japonensis TaxID=30415 RepID=A0ABC9Y6X2_GRUJA
MLRRAQDVASDGGEQASPSQSTAESKPECPLCKGRVTSILHSVRGDDDFEEHLIPPPAAPSAEGHLTGGAPGHQGAHELHRPAASQPSAAGLVPRAPVGGLQPHVWAFLLRQDRALLRPVLLWLRQELWLFFDGGGWETAAAQSLVISCLQLFGLDEESLVQLLRGALGLYESDFVRRLIEVIVARCGREARRRMGLEDAPAAEEEREGSPAAAPSPAASRGGSPAPSPAQSPPAALTHLRQKSYPAPHRLPFVDVPAAPPLPPFPPMGSEKRCRRTQRRLCLGPPLPAPVANTP